MSPISLREERGREGSFPDWVPNVGTGLYLPVQGEGGLCLGLQAALVEVGEVVLSREFAQLS